MERYKVHTSKTGRTFDTLEEARQCASRYHARTGIFVAITAVKGRKAQAPQNPAIKVLADDYDPHTNRTNILVDTPEFKQWFWVSGDMSAAEALEIARPVIERKLAELAA